MKQVNFDAIRQIKAPEELIDRTIRAAESGAAPLQTDDEPAVMPVFFRWRRLAVAAGVLLVIGVSIFVYFQIRNINQVPVPVAPATEGTTTDATASIPTGGSTAPTEPDASVSPSGQPTEPASGKPTEYSGVSPTVPSGDRPTAPTAPPATGPAVVPTQPAVIPTDPTVLSSEPPAPSLPVVEPTVSASETAVEPIEPWEDPTEPLWAKPTEPYEPIVCSGKFSSDLLDEDCDRVFCVLYDSRGSRIGSPNLYSYTHIAQITACTEQNTWVVYQVPDGILTRSDLYTAVFYDDNGTILCTATQYISV